MTQHTICKVTIIQLAYKCAGVQSQYLCPKVVEWKCKVAEIGHVQVQVP